MLVASLLSLIFGVDFTTWETSSVVMLDFVAICTLFIIVAMKEGGKK